MTVGRADDAGDDDGSVLLLTLGYALLAIVLVLVCVDATSLYLTQKRAAAAADAAARAGADARRRLVRRATAARSGWSPSPAASSRRARTA